MNTEKNWTIQSNNSIENFFLLICVTAIIFYYPELHTFFHGHFEKKTLFACYILGCYVDKSGCIKMSETFISKSCKYKKTIYILLLFYFEQNKVHLLCL